MERVLPMSASEKDYLIGGVQANIRSDGRTRLDYRCFTLETSVTPQCAGSARVHLAETDVLVGVKCEIGPPENDHPEKGRIAFSVECCASASREFEGRGGEDLNTELCRVLERSMHNDSVLDFEALSIVAGQQCWIIYVDVLVLDSGGNLLDAISIAVKAALHNTRIPKITVVAGEKDGDMEIEVDDDPQSCTRISVDKVPICVTLTKIGNTYIVDPTMEEELCMSARLTAAVNKAGNICSMQKGGRNGIDPATLQEMMQVARKLGMRIQGSLEANLSQVDLKPDSTRFGFRS